MGNATEPADGNTFRRALGDELVDGVAPHPEMLLDRVDDFFPQREHRLDGPVDLERGLFDLGLDSLMISELHEHLRSDLGLEVPLTTFLERPTLTSLSEHLAGVLVGDEPARPARAEPSEPAYDQLSEDEAIAVIARKYTTER